MTATSPPRDLRRADPVPRRPVGTASSVVTACLAVLTTLAALVVATWPDDDVLRTWEQPAVVAYADDSQHHLAVISRGPRWGAATNLTALQPRYDLYAGRDPSHGYGHVVALPVPGGSLDALGSLDDATVEWTADGVRLRMPSGHEVFVPADAFTGGR